MSDQRLRDLERAFLQSGALGDEVNLIRERVRVGVISQHALEIASELLGYPPAQLAHMNYVDEPYVWRPMDLASETQVVTFHDSRGGLHPLGVKGAAMLADQAARLLQAHAPRARMSPFVESIIMLAGDLRRCVFGSKVSARSSVFLLGRDRRIIGPVALEVVRDDPLDDTSRLSVLINLVLVYFSTRRATFEDVLQCFLRSAPIFNYDEQTRLKWARTAMMQAMIPHLLGHASTVPHPPDLSLVIPQQRAPER